MTHITRLWANAILFMADLEEKILNVFEEKPMIWWRYIDDIFFIWEHGEESLEKFLNKLNTFHPTIKFTAEYSKEAIKFLHVNGGAHDRFVY